jgi:hypothetical protein
MLHRIALILALAATPALAAPTREQQMLAAANKVSEARLRADIVKLVSFGTRHTLSSQTDPKRGIGTSVRWAEAELKKLGLDTLQTCHGDRPPGAEPDPRLQRRRDPARHRAAERRGGDHRPHRQPRDRRHGLHQRLARGQ